MAGDGESGTRLLDGLHGRKGDGVKVGQGHAEVMRQANWVEVGRLGYDGSAIRMQKGSGSVETIDLGATRVDKVALA